MTISVSEFGALADGRVVAEYTLTNKQGMSVDILTFGATIRRICVPTHQGRINCVLGYSSLEPYLADTSYIGRMIGRIAGRVSGSHFTLEGNHYALPPNEGGSHLHGGREGFHQILWEAETMRDAQGRDVLQLSHHSPHGTGGYPGNLHCCLQFCLTPENALVVTMECTTDQATPISLTRHEYFNLSGSAVSTDVRSHQIRINADQYTPFGEDMVPLGSVADVEGTPLDLRNGATLHQQFAAAPQILARGYDHYYVLPQNAASPQEAASVSCPETGLALRVLTDQPGIVFYTGGYLPQPFTGMCLEPQNFPDAINQPTFPSNILQPADTYRHTLIYSFSCTSS